jgi:hypothetical protein
VQGAHTADALQEGGADVLVQRAAVHRAAHVFPLRLLHRPIKAQVRPRVFSFIQCMCAAVRARLSCCRAVCGRAVICASGVLCMPLCESLLSHMCRITDAMYVLRSMLCCLRSLNRAL